MRSNPLTPRSFYGSNYLYELRSYIQAVDGLAQYGVHFSQYAKWGVNPRAGFWPVGVYFYILSEECDVPGGFATDRTWANIARLHNERLLIVKADSTYNYPGDAYALLQNLREEHGDTQVNRALHEMGYDGIVDYDSAVLPIESCQGVITWPTGAEYTTSIPTRRRLRRDERQQKAYKAFQHTRPGTLRFTEDEIHEALRMRPRYAHRWDQAATYRDYVGWFLSRLDFSYADSWTWAERVLGDSPKVVVGFLSELEMNPTVPRRFWQEKLKHYDRDVREAAAIGEAPE